MCCLHEMNMSCLGYMLGGFRYKLVLRKSSSKLTPRGKPRLICHLRTSDQEHGAHHWLHGEDDDH
jgi:hypothetical protein